VLNRLRWDPALHASNFIIGYLERFSGLQELRADLWIRDSTDEDFIPQHRIKYFKKVTKGNEEIVWDRDERIDLIFGSGLTLISREVPEADKAKESENVVEVENQSVDGGAPLQASAT